MSVTRNLERLQESLRLSARMPVVFLGHGSPINAIEDNTYSRSWTKLGEALPRPQAILVISAHWMTKETTLVDVSAHPRTIHDFYNFPQELYAQQYPAPGAPEQAASVAQLLADYHVQEDDRWGLDHGAWSVLKWLYPACDVPVFQLSIDMTKDLEWHLEVGKKLQGLRDHGVLILGSGNIVHNLRAMRHDTTLYDWAQSFDTRFADFLEDRNFAALAKAESFDGGFGQAHPTLDHYIPAVSVTGAVTETDQLMFANESIDLSSVSMRSFVFY